MTYRRDEKAMSLEDLVARVLRNAEASGAIVDTPDTQNALTSETVKPGSVSRTLLEELGWPKRALDFAEQASDTHAVRVMREHGERPGIVVLSGEKGSGKTVGAAWWAMNRRTGTRFVRASEFARTSKFSEKKADLIAGSKALVLDDVGAEYADDKGAFVSDLDELVDVFYSDMRKLVITTNCDGPQFAARYGERISDRLAECGRWVRIEDASMRVGTRAPWE